MLQETKFKLTFIIQIIQPQRNLTLSTLLRPKSTPRHAFFFFFFKVQLLRSDHCNESSLVELSKCFFFINILQSEFWYFLSFENVLSPRALAFKYNGQT